MSRFNKIFLGSLAAKLLIVLALPISADEAYYWTWSLKPQLGYFDHPPMVAWFYWIGNFLFPFSQILSKYPAVFWGHFNLFVWAKIYKYLLPESDRIKVDAFTDSPFKIFFYTILFSPLLGLGSLIQTPDLPLITFWSLGLFFSLKYLERPNWKNSVILGATLGFGFLAKYHMVLFIPCLLLWINWNKRWKTIPITSILICIISGLIACSPVILWNIQNDFISFKFQLNHGLGRSDYKFYWTWSYILAQFILINPVTISSLLKTRLSDKWNFLIPFSLFPLFFFLLTSFKGLVETNWPIIAYPTLLAWFSFSPLATKTYKWINSFWIALTLAVLVWSHFGDIKELNKTNEYRYFQTLYNETKNLRPLYLSTYQMAGYFTWFDSTLMSKVKGIGRVDFYDFIQESTPTEKEFYFLANNETDPPMWIKEDSRFKISLFKNINSDFRIFKIERVL